MKIHHIYTDAQGKAQIEVIEPNLAADQSGRRTLAFPTGPAYMKEFAADRISGLHNAPRRQFVVHLFGGALVHTPSGYRRDAQPGDVIFAEDLTGEGHLTDGDGSPRGALYIPVPDDFDFQAWCAGEGSGY
jgi:hypothetical protein